MMSQVPIVSMGVGALIQVPVSKSLSLDSPIWIYELADKIHHIVYMCMDNYSKET